MRIAIDAHAIGNLQTGNETYVKNLIEALLLIDNRNQYNICFTNPDAASEFNLRHDQVLTTLVPRNPVYRLLYGLPAALKPFKPDVLLVQYVAPPLSGIPTVAAIHDISYEHFPQYFRFRDTVRARLTIRHTARSAAHVLTISECSRRDISKTYGVPDDRISVAYCGVNDIFFSVSPNALDPAPREHLGIRGPYILAVGNLQPRKNIRGLLRAFSLLLHSEPSLPHQLVLVGRKAFLYDGIFEELNRLGLADRTVFTGYVPDSELPGLYAAADVFVYPSFFEGFGLPPLEAMASGTPVVVGDNSSLPEVVGDAGLLVDVSRDEEIAGAIRRILTDDLLRARLRQEGRDRARRFTWERTARQTLEVLERVAASRNPH